MRERRVIEGRELRNLEQNFRETLHGIANDMERKTGKKYVVDSYEDYGDVPGLAGGEVVYLRKSGPISFLASKVRDGYSIISCMPMLYRSNFPIQVHIEHENFAKVIKEHIEKFRDDNCPEKEIIYTVEE